MPSATTNATVTTNATHSRTTGGWRVPGGYLRSGKIDGSRIRLRTRDGGRLHPAVLGVGR